MATSSACPLALERETQLSEIKRILLRQRSADEKKKKQLSDEEVQSKAKELVNLAKAMDKEEYPHRKKGQSNSVELHTEDRRYGLVEVLGWLLVMLFLARKEHE